MQTCVYFTRSSDGFYGPAQVMAQRDGVARSQLNSRRASDVMLLVLLSEQLATAHSATAEAVRSAGVQERLHC